MTTNWYLYIIETVSGKLYTGITTDVERRFVEHRDTHSGHGRKGAKYFRAESPAKVVHTEHFATRSEATRREAEVKKLTASAKRLLLASDQRGLNDGAQS